MDEDQFFLPQVVSFILKYKYTKLSSGGVCLLSLLSSLFVLLYFFLEFLVFTQHVNFILIEFGVSHPQAEKYLKCHFNSSLLRTASMKVSGSLDGDYVLPAESDVQRCCSSSRVAGRVVA